MAAAQAARKGRKPEDIEARIDTISNAMRVFTYQALKKYQGWKSGWCIQPDENPKTLGGEVPTSVEQWHEAVKARKNMWLDWRQLMALKEDFNSTIVVWEWSGAGEWIQVARFEHSKSKEVIPLLLTGQGDERHFATVKRGAEGYPEEWNSHKESLPTWTGRAGGSQTDDGQSRVSGMSWLKTSAASKTSKRSAKETAADAVSGMSWFRTQRS